MSYVYDNGQQGGDGILTMSVANLGNSQGVATSVSAGTVAFRSAASGTGYLMYSAQSVSSRFGASGTSSSFVAVFFNSTANCWEYDNGTTAAPFNPLPTDVLVASVNFSSGAISSLYGDAAYVNGIAEGYGGTSDGLTFSASSGHFTVSGTSFVPNTTDRVTLDGYDWRDRPLWTMVYDGAHYTFTYNTYDNLDEVTNVTRYYNVDGETPSDTTPPSGSNFVIIARSGAAYDNLGREYQTLAYNEPGTIAIVTNTFFDGDGDTIMTIGGGSQEFSKTVYDGLGDALYVYTGYDPEMPTLGTTDAYTEALGVNSSDDIILTETVATYDAAGDETFEADYNRVPAASSTAGALDAISSSDSQVSYTGWWIDGVGRQTAEQDFGTLSSAPTPGTAQPTTDTSGATRVTLTEYNARGEADESIDPAGNVTFSTEDDQGRVIETIQNYNVDTDPALNITTTNNFDAADDLLASTSVSTYTGTEITAYVYGTDTGVSSPDLFDNDEIRAVVSGLTPDDDLSSLVYDVSMGDTTGLNVVEYTYDRQGETTTMVDQHLTTHTYTRNGLGALLTDSISVPSGNPAGINLSVISIDYAYKVCGRLLSVSSEDASHDVLNEIYYQYDTNGLLDKEYEDANGAIDPAALSGVTYVGYGYDDSTTETGGVYYSDTGFRPTTLQYPTTGTNASRVITDSYGTSGSMDDEINQLNSILDGSGTATSVTTSTTLDTFGQMGDGTIVSEDFNQPSIGYNLLGSTGSQPNLDQFGRVQDMVWAAIGSGDLLDGYAYARNLQGDVTSRQNLALDAYNTATTPLDPVYLDQVYGHDALNQLNSLTQGKLVDGSIPTDAVNYSQNFSLDGFGNWSNYAATSGGTTTVDQNRGTNSLNQITGFSDPSGVTLTPWQAPAYDAVGNMTTVPQPGAETGTPLTCQYDAWDRLAAVYSSSTLVAAYDYDGLNRLIETKSDYVTAGPQSVVYDLYAGQQLIETRSATFTAGDAAPSAVSLAPSYQYVWSASGSNVPMLRDTYSSGSLVSADQIYFLTDANDNVTAITNSSGSVLERYSYYAYGGVTVYSPTWTSPSTTSSYGNTILFAGMNLDMTTGLYHDMARWYNSSLGAFITTDPAQSTDNLYAYCGNDPIDETDPTGLVRNTPVASFSAPSNPCSAGSAGTSPTPIAPAVQPFQPHWVSNPNGTIVFVTNPLEEIANAYGGPSNYNTLALSNSDSTTHEFHLTPLPVQNGGPTVGVGGAIAAWWGANNVDQRIWGGFKVLAGYGEMAAGTALGFATGVFEIGSLGALTPAALVTGALSVGLIANGIDVSAAGATEVWTGKPQKTVTEQLLVGTGGYSGAQASNLQNGVTTVANIGYAVKTLSDPCPAEPVPNAPSETITQSVGDLRAAGLKDAHHVIQDAAVRDLPGYDTQAAPGVQLEGPSTTQGTPHYNATQVQRLPGGGTYGAEQQIAYDALRAAGYSDAEATQAVQEADNYFRGIGVNPQTPTRIPGNR
jgi:RHS repeat-associated protein